MSDAKPLLDLLFLGSGNAFGSQGRAFSSLLVNGRYLFDCGPTLLQQLHKTDLTTDDIDVVLISHFHADHFFGLPFLMLAAKYGGRSKDLTIVGPPGIEQNTEALLRLGYPATTADQTPTFKRRYIEVTDGARLEVEGMCITAKTVEHVDEFECFAFRAEVNGRSLLYSGDTTMCEGLMHLVPNTDVIVVECSCKGVPVHLSHSDVTAVADYASPGTQVIITHLESDDHPEGIGGLIVAQDLWRYRV